MFFCVCSCRYKHEYYDAATCDIDDELELSLGWEQDGEECHDADGAYHPHAE